MEQGTYGHKARRAGCGVADEIFVDAWNHVLPDLRRRALRLTCGHFDRAEDLIANTALKALMFMRRSPEMLTDPNGFLFVVLRHVFLDSVRRRAPEDRIFERIGDDSPVPDLREESLVGPQRIEVEEQLALIQLALQTMKDEQRRLFAYRFIDDLSYPVIADRLQINETVARKRIQLLRRKLRTVAGAER